MSEPVQSCSAESVDATRYRRLRVLGVAPAYTDHLKNGDVMRFTNLDEFVDKDIAWTPSRGEANPLQEARKPTKVVYVKRWRTLVELPEQYADEIVQALREPQSAQDSPAGSTPTMHGAMKNRAMRLGIEPKETP